MTGVPETNLAKLAEPFPPDIVSWRLGSTNGDKTRGLALAYIDARDVQDRLDEVCGAANWQVRHPWADGKKLCCEIGIRVNGEWIWKGDGAGDSDVEAEKGAFSDSFKRAAVRWGIGRYLYDVQSPWVELEAAGRSHKIKESEYARLRAVLPKPAVAKAPATRTAPKNEPAPTNADALRKGITSAETLFDLSNYWREHWPQITALPPDVQADLTKVKDARKAELTKNETLMAG